MILDIKNYTRCTENTTYSEKSASIDSVKNSPEYVENITIFTKHHKSEAVEKAIQRAQKRSW